MGRGFLFALLLCVGMTAESSWARQNAPQAAEGFFQVEPGVSLYAKVIPGQPGAPVFVLLNGLTQDIDHWSTTVPYLQEKGATIVEIDLALQGRSMEKLLKEKFTPFNPVLPPLVMHGGLWDLPPTFPAVPITSQSRFVSKLLQQLGITQPVTLLGLSYGGGLALQMAADYPEQIAQAILAAPYAFPLPDQDGLIRLLVKTIRNLYPQWRMVSFDNLYDLVLRGMVVSTYHLAEPEVLKWSPPFQSIAASELVRGIRHMSYMDLLKKLKVPLHLIIAGRDSYIPRDKLDEFWAQVPAPEQGSTLEIEGSEHKMNESVGPFLASWAWELASNPDYLQHPGQFIGVPEDGVATEINGPRKVQLEKATPCQDWLVKQSWKEIFAKIRENPTTAIYEIIKQANPLPDMTQSLQRKR